MKTTRKRKDSYGRTWIYNRAEGTYHLGKTLIGCGARNKYKWSVWSGPFEGEREFETLREAMKYCWGGTVQQLNRTEEYRAFHCPTETGDRQEDCFGRSWIFNRRKGTWHYYDHVVAPKPGTCDDWQKWQIIGGPSEGKGEFDTFKEAMAACIDLICK